MKFCYKCGETKPLGDFGNNRSRRDGKDPKCKSCVSAYFKAYYAKKRENFQAYQHARVGKWAKTRRDYHVKSRYNLDQQEVAALMDKQGGVCAGCGAPEPRYIDHDHACCAARTTSCGSCVRGVLCQKCNSALGMVRDNPEILDALAAYLIRWKNREVLK